ncbi:MAG: hypothetical protein ABIJ09_17680, partial [Pseudomonadota bacterium]
RRVQAEGLHEAEGYALGLDLAQVREVSSQGETAKVFAAIQRASVTEASEEGPEVINASRMLGLTCFGASQV